MITMTSFLPALLCNCFRLLNSEIGNDQKSMEMIKKAFRGFRLLNSEIGNDPNPSATMMILNGHWVFVSLTRR